MRNSKTRAGFRPLRIGIAAAATAAVVVAGTATSAFAAAGTITVTPTVFTTTNVTGATLTITGSGTSLAASDSAYFIPASATTCPADVATTTATYPTATQSGTYSNTGGTASTLLMPALAPGSWKLCIFATGGALSTGPSNAITVVPANAAVSPASGPTGGGNTISFNEPVPTDPTLQFVQGTTAVVFVAGTTCLGANSGAYGTPGGTLTVAPAAVTVVGPGRLGVTVPSGVTSGNYAPAYSVCVYNGTASGSPLVARADAAYTVGVLPTITSVTPATGAPQGGGTVTIVGTNLGSATVTIGGSPVTKNAASSTSTTFVGTTGPHPVDGPLPVVVSIAGGGTATKAAAFTYTNGVVVSPNTSPNTRPRTDIDVQGSGFASMNFATTNGLTPNDNNAHVYLVKGLYDPTKNTAGGKTVGQTTECLRVVVVSDNELMCTLYLGGVPLNASHSDITATVSGNVVTATAGTFNLGDVGETVTGPTAITAGTAIASVTDATHAVLTKAPTTNVTTPTALTLAPTRTFADAATTSGSATITSATGAFTTADIGRGISGTGIPAGTTITAVTNATTATLSAAATATGTNVSTTVTNVPGPVVPNGTYSVAVAENGGVDVQPGGTMADPNFLRSIISSGSTFTVADY